MSQNSKFLNLNRGLSGAGSIGGEPSGFLSKAKQFGSAFSTTTIVFIVASILFVIGGIYYYYTYVSPKLNTTYSPNNEYITGDTNGPAKQAELLMFYADWCPHCKTAKPAWNEVAEEYQNKTINGYKVIFNDINCTNETDEVEKMMNQYKVEGFPTIKMIKDGQVIEYDAKPTKETLVEFLNTVL